MGNADKIEETENKENTIETQVETVETVENVETVEETVENVETVVPQNNPTAEVDIHQEVIQLLKTELDSFSSVQQKINFDIEKEFVKAKENEKKFVWNKIIKHLLIAIVIVLGTSIGISLIIEQKSRNQIIHVNDFDSINMKSLSEQVAAIKGKREIAIYDKQRYMDELEKSIETINKEFELNMQILDSVYYNMNKAALDNSSSENAELAEVSVSEENNENLAEISSEEVVQTEETAEITETQETSTINLELFDKNAKEAYENQKAQYESIRDEKIAQVTKVAERRIAELDASIALYDERLKHYDETIVASVEEQNMIDEQSYKYIKIINDYEDKLAAADIKYNQQIDENLASQKELVNRVTKEFDPEVSTESKVYKQVLSKNKNYQKEYSNSVKVNDKASQEFKNSLENQKEYYTDLYTVYDGYSSYPQKTDNAIPVYAATMNGIAVTAANEFTTASVNEINSLLDQKDILQSEYFAFVDSMCGTEEGENRVYGMVIKVQGNDYQLYLRKDELIPYFTDIKYSRQNKVVRVMRGDQQIAKCKMEYENGEFKLKLNENTQLMIGDKLLLEPLKTK